MAKSRMAAALLLLATPGAAGAQPPTDGDPAMRTYRHIFPPTSELNCPRQEGDEILVCARRRDEIQPERLPLPVAEAPGARVAGETLSGTAALAAGGCMQRCHKPVTLNILVIGGGGGSPSVADMVGALDSLLSGD